MSEWGGPAGPMRYLERTLPTLAENLALDEALLQEVEDLGLPPVMRVWEAPAVAVVMGASCRLGDAVYDEACRADGVPIARRSSGGGTVVIGPGALNAAIVVPRDAAPGFGAVDTAQVLVLSRLAATLRDLGVPAEVRGSGDLALGPRKFSGSAQRRLRRHFLVHATILYRFPLDLVTRYTPSPRRQPEYRQDRSHNDFLTNLDLPRADLLAAIRSAWLPPDAAPSPADVPASLIERLVREKFGDPGWVARF